MEYEIVYSNESLEDLFKIYDYITNVQNEKANAIKLIETIKNSIKKLNVFPLRHPVVNFSPWKNIGIRYIIIKNHIIFYFVNEKENIVNIIRIFSSKQDIEKIINN